MGLKDSYLQGKRSRWELGMELIDCANIAIVFYVSEPIRSSRRQWRGPRIVGRIWQSEMVILTMCRFVIGWHTLQAVT